MLECVIKNKQKYVVGAQKNQVPKTYVKNVTYSRGARDSKIEKSGRKVAEF